MQKKRAIRVMLFFTMHLPHLNIVTIHTNVYLEYHPRSRIIHIYYLKFPCYWHNPCQAVSPWSYEIFKSLKESLLTNQEKIPRFLYGISILSFDQGVTISAITLSDQ